MIKITLVGRKARLNSLFKQKEQRGTHLDIRAMLGEMSIINARRDSFYGGHLLFTP
jgi:hypothetical protein